MKRTEALPGGAAARLTFCRLMLEKPNVLLVTHDHDVIHEVASRIWSFCGRGD